MTIHFFSFAVHISIDRNHLNGNIEKTQKEMKEQLLNRKAFYRYLY
ncbi:hypothetical protein [Halobacillus massiliensis]|nr:hypothetical protein [Halobacillus massiliensis]